VSNYKNTVAFSNRFLGMKSSHPDFKEEVKYLTVKHQITEDQIEFLVNYQGN